MSLITGRRLAVVGGSAAALTLLLAAPAAAHVTVNPGTATQGGYATVTFRVPNERDQASTTKLEVNLPADAPVASVKVRPVPGWTARAETTRLVTPITAHGTQITEAVAKITWTADPDSAIRPGEFQQFDVSLGPLPQVKQMIFKALQTYSDGNVVRWIDEPQAGTEPDHPAPVLTLTPAGAPATAAATDRDGTPYGIAGIVLGTAGLLLGLLAYRRAGRRTATGPAAERRPADAEAGPADKPTVEVR